MPFTESTLACSKGTQCPPKVRRCLPYPALEYWSGREGQTSTPVDSSGNQPLHVAWVENQGNALWISQPLPPEALFGR